MMDRPPSGAILVSIRGTRSLNAQIQAAKARARGFRRIQNLIKVSYLVCGKLSHLPASPYGTTSRVAAA